MMVDYQNPEVTTPPGKRNLREVEKECIIDALTETKGVTQKAAKLLDIPNSTLRDKIKRYGIDFERFKN